jgi:hypothetical protein
LKLKPPTFGSKLVSSALIALFWFQSVNGFGWGNEGHEYVNRVAAEKIPAEMPRFFRHAVAELTYLGLAPRSTLSRMHRNLTTTLISSVSRGSIRCRKAGTSFIANFTKSAPRPPIILTTTFRNTWAFSRTSRWKFSAG